MSLPLTEPYRAIASTLVAGARLMRRERLTGGVSAEVESITLKPKEGPAQRYVIRQQGADWKGSDCLPIRVEYELLMQLCEQGFAVPRPYLLDASGTLLGRPSYVMAFVEGRAEIEDALLPSGLRTMATVLAEFHDTADLRLLPALPERQDIVTAVAALEIPQSEERQEMGRAVDRLPPLTEAEPALLHGDYWPGNLLWRGAKLAAVIDWEDAAVGDPASDLAGARLELTLRYDSDAADAFTTHYLACSSRSPQSFVRLPLWEMYVAAAALGTMERWKLDVATLQDWRARARSFFRRSLQMVTT